MTISEMLLPEFDREMASTRKVLERVPLEKPDWKPHPKSMTIGRLAGHIAELPGWAVQIFTTEVLDLTPAITSGHRGYEVNSSADLLLTFEKNVAESRAALAGASDQHLMQTWSMLLHGKMIVSSPRLEVVRSMFLNHLIHHRGQLGVYLRLNDIPLPAIYGPSADEGQSFATE